MTIHTAPRTAAEADALITLAEAELQRHVFPALEATCHTTTERVLQAMQTHRLGEEHFYSVTGYGHNDLGRDALDAIFADALQAEAALVRPHIVSGTHALAVALRGNVSRGQTMLSVTGEPYDTLEEVIGLRGDSTQSLQAYGIHYQSLDVFKTPEGEALTEGIRLSFTSAEVRQIQQAQLLYIQRSRGYSTRPALTIDPLRQLIAALREHNPTAVVMVDNCYGEFIEPLEPTAVGANLMAGSLIKNAGGGIALTGGYVAGDASCVERAAEALTCPGIGSHGGYMFNQTRTLLQGLYFAPMIVKEALKGMSLAAYLLETHYGMKVSPRWEELPRADMIQTLWLGSPERQEALCKLVQQCSPVHAYVTPVPSHAPGYESALIMAGGTFVDGSTVELSADGPIRPPYTLYLQGGLNYSHTRLMLKHLLLTFEGFL
ncbi:MAG: methionine gamma-lyase family protein [Vampirovibrionales bacterium]